MRPLKNANSTFLAYLCWSCIKCQLSLWNCVYVCVCVCLHAQAYLCGYLMVVIFIMMVFPSPSLISLTSKMRIYKTLWQLLNIRCMSGSRKKKNDYDYTEFVYCRIKMAPIAFVSIKD